MENREAEYYLLGSVLKSGVCHFNTTETITNPVGIGDWNYE